MGGVVDYMQKEGVVTCVVHLRSEWLAQVVRKCSTSSLAGSTAGLLYTARLQLCTSSNGVPIGPNLAYMQNNQARQLCVC
jgi:hypothetical protein